MTHISPTIYIRVDGNEIIATGHVMRCLSIATRLRQAGCSVIFLTADEKPSELIASRGFAIEVLHTVWNQLDEEANILCHYLSSHNANVLLLDSYQVTFRYLAALSRIVKVIYIDDLYRFAYPVHTVINYSVWAKEETYRDLYQNPRQNPLTPIPQFLIGSRYLPLREEFSHKDRSLPKKAGKVLITMGGTDSHNVIGKLLPIIFNEKKLNNCDLQTLEYHIIVGIFHQHKEELKSLEALHPAIHLHENVSNMSEYMRMCDIAISAGGSTLYELCACGTPTIVMEIADNQSGAKLWEEQDYMLYAGNIERDEASCLEQCRRQLVRYAKDYGLRVRHSQHMQTLIDGEGAQRIAEYLLHRP